MSIIEYSIRNDYLNLDKILAYNIDDYQSIKSSLFLIVEYGYSKCLQIFIKHNISMNFTKSFSNNTLIISACENLSYSCLKLLLEYDTSLLNNCDNNGCDALYYTIVKKDYDSFKLLLKYNVNLNHTYTSRNYTILHLIVLINDLKMLNKLLKL